MIEHSYPECTTSVITALSIFKKHYPDYRHKDIAYVESLHHGTVIEYFFVQAHNPSRSRILA